MEGKIDMLEICEEGLSYIDKLTQNFPSFVPSLNDISNFSEGIYLLMPLFEGIEWLYNVLVKAEDIDRMDFSTFAVGEQTAQHILNRFKQFVDQLCININANNLEELVNIISSNLSIRLTEMKNLYLSLSSYYQSSQCLQ